MKKHWIEYVAILLCVSFLLVFVVAFITPPLTSFHEIGMSRLEARTLWLEATVAYTITAQILLITSAVCAFVVLSYLAVGEFKRKFA